MTDVPVRIEASGDDVLLWIKVVPGAKRDAVVGPLGDRLKVRVSAPPESGKANRAACALLAHHLGARPRDVVIERGATSPDKVLRVKGMRTAAATERLR